MSRHLRHDSVLVVFDGEWGATPAPHHAISNNHSGGDRRGGGVVKTDAVRGLIKTDTR